MSLVLGSGGARGLAHIGVIRCLEDRGFEIGYIAGSSIGALVGGIYATGKLDDYARWVSALRRADIIRLLDFSFRRGAIFSGDRIIGALESLIGEHDFADLRIGFTAVATELNDKREIWLNKGKLFPAIRASFAMPLIFEPVELDGRLLVDGGLINPVPIAPTLNDSSEITIAVDLSARAEQLPSATESGNGDAGDQEQTTLREKIAAFVESYVTPAADDDDGAPGSIEIALRSLDTMQVTISRLKLAAYAPRVIIDVPRNLATLFEFHRADELIDFGYRRAGEALDHAGL